MSVTSTTATNAATTATNVNDLTQTHQSQLPQQTLGQADFLKLLVAQLSAQDPMNPMSNTDFAAQMAQFSTLQTTQTMQTNMAAVQASMGILVADSVLGRTVNLQTSDGQTVTGVVSTVDYQSGTPTITVNGQVYNLSQVISVSQTQTPTSTSN
jgi:flagellar basal-body rod modification protein FlgD